MKRNIPRVGRYFDPRQRMELDFFEGVETYAAEEAEWELVPIPDCRLNTRLMLPGMKLDGLVVAERHLTYLPDADWRFPVSACHQELRTYPGSHLEDRLTGRMAAEHLLGLGAKTLVYFHDLSRAALDAERLAGFRERVEARGRKVLDFAEGRRMKRYGWSLERQVEDLADFLRKHEEPLGVFCFDDVHAERMMLACARAGRRIPEEVALLGVTDVPAFCEVLRPRLSAVEVDTVGMGRAAAAVLEDLLQGREAPRHIAVPPLGIQARESTRVLMSPDELIRRANAWLEAREPSDWSVKIMSRDLHCSQMTLLRRFQRELGRSPLEEIQRRKLERARRLLREDRETVSTIAQDCGFTDAAHFTHVFVRETGLTPGVYRKEAGRK